MLCRDTVKLKDFRRNERNILLTSQDGRQTAISFRHSQTTQLFQGPRLIIIGEKIHTIPLLPESSTFGQRLYEVDDKCAIFVNGEALNMPQGGEVCNRTKFQKMGNLRNTTVFLPVNSTLAISRLLKTYLAISMWEAKQTFRFIFRLRSWMNLWQFQKES